MYHKRIEDTFTPVIKDKLKNFNVEVKGHITVPDEKEKIIDAIWKLKLHPLEINHLYPKLFLSSPLLHPITTYDHFYKHPQESLL